MPPIESAEQLNLLNKPSLLPNICAIEIDASASYLPAQNGALQPFSNTYIEDSSARPIYFGKGSVSYAQQGRESKSGDFYEQVLKIKFPNGDLLSSERIQEYKKVKFIYIKLSNGVIKLMGRNDYFQNAPPKCDVKSNLKIVQITYKTKSIFPIGDTNGSGQHLLPGDFPLNFFIL